MGSRFHYVYYNVMPSRNPLIIPGSRVNAAASICVYLREDSWGDAVSFLPVLKTTEEKAACEHPVYYHQKAPYGVFKRLDVVPEVYGEDVSREDE